MHNVVFERQKEDITRYSEATSTGATRGLSANQKPILKQRIDHADLTGNCLILFIYWFFFVLLVSILNFWRSSKTLRVFFTAEVETLLILLLRYWFYIFFSFLGAFWLSKDIK